MADGDGADREHTVFSGRLPDYQDDYHIVLAGTLRLINYRVGIDEFTNPYHRDIINKKVVPFLVKATQALGPGEYKLGVVGFGSATGTYQLNKELSNARALKAGNYAVAQYEAQADRHPHVKERPIKVVVLANGKINSSIEAHERGLKDSADIEANQSHYRAVMFALSAKRKPAKGDNIYWIREIYVTEFKPKEEPLPASVEWLKSLAENPIVDIILGQVAGRMLKGVVGLLAGIDVPGHIVKFMVPASVVYCYEMRDPRRQHALYRYDGSENSDEWGFGEGVKFLEALGKITKLVAVLKKLADAVKFGKEANDLFKKAEELIEGVQKEIVAKARQRFGDRIANGLDAYLTAVRNGHEQYYLFSPTSDWTSFQFHLHRNKPVQSLEGPARRTAFVAAFNQVVDLDFAGYVENNWRDYYAKAKITSYVPSLFGSRPSKGTMKLVRGPYGTEVSVSATVPLK